MEKHMKQIEHLSSLAPQSPSNITGPHVLSTRTRVVMWHCWAPQAPETFQYPWRIAFSGDALDSYIQPTCTK